jgi:hypothetical protein
MDSVDLEQGTQEWRDARLGFLTASRIHDVLTKPRKRGQEESSSRRNYKAQLVCEILSGKLSKDDQIETWWMKRGTELEPDARVEYEMRNGVMVQTCGFVQHPRIPRYGCSPDGLIGDDGLMQIKCLSRANHIECLTSGIPSELKEQMVAELSVTGRAWNDFVSYHPEFPDKMKLYVKRVYRKDELPLIEKMEAEAVIFNKEVDAMLAQLRQGDDLTAVLQESIAQVSAK